jgi:hypothetical protein
MPSANLILSREEYELLGNRDVILTKNALMEQLSKWLAGMADLYRDHVSAQQYQWPAAFMTSPKIAKGEQHEGFPWLMLDYPRLFTQQDTCAIRSFCWWGHYASIGLHLSGWSLQKYLPAVQVFVQELYEQGETGWYLSKGSDPWGQQLDGPDFIPLQVFESGYWQEERAFIRVIKKIPLDKWDQWTYLFDLSFKAFCGVLSSAQAVE